MQRAFSLDWVSCNDISLLPTLGPYFKSLPQRIALYYDSFVSISQSPNALSPCTQKSILQKYNKKIENLEKELQDETTEKEELYQSKSQLEKQLTSLGW